MSKYINADELIEALDDQIENEDSETDYKKGVQHGFWIIRNTIEETPSTDVVEVVRCKDCKHFIKSINKGCCRRVGYFLPDDFCSYGERKETE